MSNWSPKNVERVPFENHSAHPTTFKDPLDHMRVEVALLLIHVYTRKVTDKGRCGARKILARNIACGKDDGSKRFEDQVGVSKIQPENFAFTFNDGRLFQ